MNRSSSNSVAVSEMSVAAAGDFVAVLVEHQIADHDLRAARLARHAGAPQQRAQPQHHLFEAERLGDVVVAARGQTRDAVFDGVLRGQQQQRQSGICSRSLCRTSRPLMSGSITSSTTHVGRGLPGRRNGRERRRRPSRFPNPRTASAIDTSSASTGSSSTTSTWMGLPSARRMTTRAGFVLVDGETAGTGHGLIIRGAHESRLCPYLCVSCEGCADITDAETTHSRLT